MITVQALINKLAALPASAPVGLVTPGPHGWDLAEVTYDGEYVLLRADENIE